MLADSKESLKTDDLVILEHSGLLGAVLPHIYYPRRSLIISIWFWKSKKKKNYKMLSFACNRRYLGG
jgi:hypothetical protein